MRGFVKIVALLSTRWAAGLVIPDGTPSGFSNSIYQPDSLPSEISFGVAHLTSRRTPTIFHFAISGTEKVCGETAASINGQLLESEWSGEEATGRAFLDVSGDHEAVWSITCLHDPAPSLADSVTKDRTIHLIRLHFEGTAEHFAISYRQANPAGIIRFSRDALSSDTITSSDQHWLQPQNAPSKATSERASELTTPLKGSNDVLAFLATAQRRLKANILEWTGYQRPIAGILHSRPSRPPVDQVSPGDKAIDAFYPKNIQLDPAKSQAFPEVEMDIDSTSAFDFIENDELDSLPTAVPTQQETTKTKSHASAAETRSLHNSDIASEELSATEADGSAGILNVSTKDCLTIATCSLLALILCAWVISRCKDPRRRAERAARREERRNRRLYRRAATRYRIRTFLGQIRNRMTKPLLVEEGLDWMEKTESPAMTGVDDTNEASRSTATSHGSQHRFHFSAAGTGRPYFSDSDDEQSNRRQSISTLPGYESDSSQLPPYEASRSWEHPSLTTDSALMTAEVDSNPESSVVTTSPRISRDGTNSDFDEKIEILRLDVSDTGETRAWAKR